MIKTSSLLTIEFFINACDSLENVPGVNGKYGSSLIIGFTY